MYDSDKGGIFLSNKSYLSRAKRIVVIQSFFYSFILHFLKVILQNLILTLFSQLPPFTFFLYFANRSEWDIQKSLL